MQNLSEEQIAYLRATDARIRALDTSLLVEKELRESKTLELIIAAMNDDAQDAMIEFADCNPYDQHKVLELQARVARCLYTKRTIDLIRSAGAVAASSLDGDQYHAEDAIRERFE